MRSSFLIVPHRIEARDHYPPEEAEQARRGVERLAGMVEGADEDEDAVR